MTIADQRAGSIYGTNGTSGAGFGRAQMCPGMTYGDIATPGGIEQRLGGASGGAGYFNKAAFCAPPVDRQRNRLWQFGRWRYPWAGPIQLGHLDSEDDQNLREPHTAIPRRVLQHVQPSAVHQPELWSGRGLRFAERVGWKLRANHVHQRESAHHPVGAEVYLLGLERGLDLSRAASWLRCRPVEVRSAGRPPRKCLRTGTWISSAQTCRRARAARHPGRTLCVSHRPALCPRPTSPCTRKTRFRPLANGRIHSISSF